jgi:DNA-directed RNA polymerase subunit RPC12/RpoP
MLGVTWHAKNRGMTVLLLCPWCEDEVAFAVDEPRDELVCEACGTRTLFAPDPATTFSLLYEAA